MDIKRLKQLAGLSPLVEAWDGDDFKKFMDNDEDDRDYGSDSVRPTDEVDADPDVDADPEDSDDMPPVQDKDSAKRAAAAIAAMRKIPSSVSDNPEDSDDLDADLSGADGDPSDGTPDSDGSDGGPNLIPDIDPPTLAPDMAGGEPATASLARGEKMKKATAYITINPGATRGEFMKFAARELQMGPKYASALFHMPKIKAIRKGVQTDKPPVDAPMEFWVIKNPGGKVLAEGSVYDVPLWTSFERVGMFEPAVMTEMEAKVCSEKLKRNGIKHEIEHITLPESFDEPAQAPNALVGKKIKFKTGLTERVGTVYVVESNRAYVTDDKGEVWSTSLRYLKG